MVKEEIIEEIIETNCRKCFDAFTIKYNKDATCEIIKSCKCGFNED